MASAIDVTKPVAGSPTTESVRANFAAAKSEIELLQQTAGVGPQGPKGDTGPAGTIDVGTVNTGIPGSNVTITSAGTPQARILNFTIPRGDAGTAGGGITETQAVDAVRQGQVRFQEATVTTAPAFPTTPNIATTAPVVGAGWATTGDPILGPWEHTSGTGTLAFPINITAGDAYQIVFTITTVSGIYADLFGLFFRTGPTVTTDQQVLANNAQSSMTFIARAERTFSHLVIVPVTGWSGTFTLTRIVRAVTQNSSAFSIKDQLVTVRASGDIFIGNGGKSFTGTSNTNQNTAFGTNSLVGLTAAQYDSAFGAHALACASTAGTNSAFGYRALMSNTTGGSNTAVGAYALASASGAPASNVAVGWCAMLFATGSRDTAVGNAALRHGQLPSSNDNTVIGSDAMVGATAAGKQAGNNNTAIGSSAGRYLSGTTVHGGATNSIFIGYQSRSSADNQDNQIVIGINATGHGSNTITLGNSAITALHCNVQTISVLSDNRVKDEIHPADLDMCLSTVRSLPVHRWHWQNIAGYHLDKHVTGFLSDSIKKVFPKAVTAQDEYLTVRDDSGKAEMTMVSEVTEPPDDTATPQVENKLMEKTVEVKDVQRVQLTEILPTLWGAVQRIISQIDDIERRLQALSISPGSSTT